MNLVQTKGDGVQTIVVISASFKGEDTSIFKSTADKLIGEGVKEIYLDLSNPLFIDSSAVGKILYVNKKMEKLGGKLIVHKINSTLYHFLDSLSLTSVIEIRLPEE